MAGLSVRKLDDETLSRLRIRAAKHGVSMEEEVRRILKDAVRRRTVLVISHFASLAKSAVLICSCLKGRRTSPWT